MRRLYFAQALIFLLLSGLQAQRHETATTGEIYAGIQKLRVLGSAMYIAAHPDDENTRLISYLANDRKVETTYLSVTRGGGGQNLIGPEISELLGVIRTQELLQARQIDHGRQHFTRAVDFGYSKTPEESLEFWNKDEVLGDVVWAIRKFQPDIIVNRFSAEPTPGNHGHHVASAMLSVEAFELAADPQAYPEQLKYVDTWQPQRVFFNTHWWFYGGREEFDKIDKSNMVKVDVGGFDPILAESYPEIAARSRSMHKSQGFGSSGTRGEEIEYLDRILGDIPGSQSDLFDNINITWSRLPGGELIDHELAQIEKDYDFLHPYLSIPALLELRSKIERVPESIWRQRKLGELDELVIQAMGLYLEARAATPLCSPGDSLQVSIEVVKRAPVDATLTGVSMSPGGQSLDLHGEMNFNKVLLKDLRVRMPESLGLTPPYWLQNTWKTGSYTVAEQKLIGIPETPRAVMVTFEVALGNDTLQFIRPLVYKETDPVKGEVYRPFEIVPPVFVNMESQVYMFTGGQARQIKITVRSAGNHVDGTLVLTAPEGWNVEPKSHQISLASSGMEQGVSFEVLPQGNIHDGELKAQMVVGDKVCDYMLTEIQYDHIPTQTVLRKSIARASNLDLKHGIHRIAYIQGAGDEMARCLREVGYSVDELTLSDVNGNNLKAYDAVVLGIRAYNTLDRIQFAREVLFRFVQEGGTLITQYNTTRSLETDNVAPYALELSRLRVTEEDAEVHIVHPEHLAMREPNQISAADFDGWVQERGLYFPEKWDNAFTPLLSMSDTGESALEGGILVAEYGKGHFVYTSLSFFRQLPAGVPGAYRVFANLLALGQNGRS